MYMETLEAAIGRDAAIKLRDWLLANFPVNDAFTAPAGERYVNEARMLSHPKHGSTYAIVQYHVNTGDTRRTWFKVVDSRTGKTAVQLGRSQRLGIKLDFFISFDEAWRAIDKL